jgi:hypothetical protein
MSFVSVSIRYLSSFHYIAYLFCDSFHPPPPVLSVTTSFVCFNSVGLELQRADAVCVYVFATWFQQHFVHPLQRDCSLLAAELLLPKIRQSWISQLAFVANINNLIWNYKVVQIWPGQTVTCLHTNRPGHIWTTLYSRTNSNARFSLYLPVAQSDIATRPDDQGIGVWF